MYYTGLFVKNVKGSLLVAYRVISFSGHLKVLMDGTNLHVLMNIFTFQLATIGLGTAHVSFLSQDILGRSEGLCLFKTRDMNNCLRCSHPQCMPPKLGYFSQPCSWMVQLSFENFFYLQVLARVVRIPFWSLAEVYGQNL